MVSFRAPNQVEKHLISFSSGKNFSLYRDCLQLYPWQCLCWNVCEICLYMFVDSFVDCRRGACEKENRVVAQIYCHGKKLSKWAQQNFPHY